MQERVLYKNCPLCESAAIAEHRIGNCSQHPSYRPQLSNKIRWMQCAGCGHVFTEGYYTDEALNLIFEKTQSNQNVGDDLEQNRLLSARMIDKITPFKDRGIWLDVGFGNGSLLFTAKEYGFKPIGLDLREQTVAQMKTLGIEAHRKDVCDFTSAEKVAVISMADVLEHTHYPKLVLAAARGLLEDDGVLFVSMPNTDTILWDVTTKQNVNPFWGEMEHYHNFSRGRLYALLRETGFTPLRYGISERYRMCMEVIARPKAA
ncbi:MAG: class I SAM-dependent methyltransferase [Oricola sp.]